ncbi:MAG TPA: Uma2 family endonuclease [Planctomycetota bacterium]|nr:Uma2 family endonuclease [Planctomycetota bacterium]
MSVVIDGKTLLTYSDYVHFPEDGQKHEIIGGVHYVTASPFTRHQRISRWMQFQLFEQIEVPGHGHVIDAPMDVIFSDIDIVQPDLIVVLEKQMAIITEKHIRGVPDLVVEITSPSTKKRDLELKKSLYQSHGVPEYWVVLADTDAVEQHVLDAGVYQLAGRFEERIEFRGRAGVAVDLKKVW